MRHVNSNLIQNPPYCVMFEKGINNYRSCCSMSERTKTSGGCEANPSSQTRRHVSNHDASPEPNRTKRTRITAVTIRPQSRASKEENELRPSAAQVRLP